MLASVLQSAASPVLESCTIDRPVLAEPGQENAHPRRLRCQLDVYLRAEVQRLCARELLAHHNLATQVKRNQLKDCLTKITDAWRLRLARSVLCPLSPFDTIGPVCYTL